MPFPLSPQYLVLAVPPHPLWQPLHTEPDDDCSGNATGGGGDVIRQWGTTRGSGRGGVARARPSGLCFIFFGAAECGEPRHCVSVGGGGGGGGGDGSDRVAATTALVASGQILPKFPAAFLVAEE